MGGKGGGAVATNDQMVQMQMQQAAQAKEANLERNARLQYGTQQINDIFSGHPADATQLDLSSLAQPGAQAPGYSPTTVSNPGYGTQTYDPTLGTWVQAPSGPGTPGGLAGGYRVAQMPDSGGSTQYGLYGPDGSLVTTAGSLADLSKAQVYYGGTQGGPTTGGFDPGFYDKFRQAQLDYYLPQEGEQYNTARSGLAYSLARAGTLNSSIAGTDVAKLANQDQINKAQIAAQADNQTGQLRNTVQQDQQSALNQLYSTEDPTVSANTAENMVANAQLTKPLLNPAGALFTPIIAGVGNAMTGFTNPYAYINNAAGSMGMATTPSGSQAQGSTISGNQ
jgi:hypothetical protein